MSLNGLFRTMDICWGHQFTRVSSTANCTLLGCNEKAEARTGGKEGEMEEELLKTLGDFTSRENWDKFFTIKGSHDPFKWYSEWPEIGALLLHELHSLAPPSPDGRGTGDCSGRAATPDATACRILVPGCGNSRLSESLYDAGFRLFHMFTTCFTQILLASLQMDLLMLLLIKEGLML